MELTSALFWDFTQCTMVVSYWRFGTSYRLLLWGPSSPFFSNCMALEDGTDRLPRNVDKKLPFYVTWNNKRAPISFTPRQKPEMTKTLKLHGVALKHTTLHATHTVRLKLSRDGLVEWASSTLISGTRFTFRNRGLLLYYLRFWKH